MSIRTVEIPTSRSHTSSVASFRREISAVRRAAQNLILRRLLLRRQSFSDSPLYDPSDSDRNEDMGYLTQEMDSLDLEYDRNGVLLYTNTDTSTPSNLMMEEGDRYPTNSLDTPEHILDPHFNEITPSNILDNNNIYRYDVNDIVETREDGQHYLMGVIDREGFRGRAATPRYVTEWDTAPALFPRDYELAMDSYINARQSSTNAISHPHNDLTNSTPRTHRRILPRSENQGVQSRSIGGLTTWSSEYAEKYDFEQDNYVSETSEGEVDYFHGRYYTPDR